MTEFVPDIPPSNEFWDTSKTDISHVDKNRKLVALTFDDAPAKYLENLLAIFAAFNEKNPDCRATATIFCNGLRIDKNMAPLLHSAVALGWELGNHGYSHKDLSRLEKINLKEEIERTDRLLFSIDGQEKHLLRAPFGNVNELVRDCAQTPIISWTVDTLDWTGVAPEEIQKSVLDGLFSGAIVLMHDGYGNTVKALKTLLPALKERGYQAVSLSQMIKAHNCTFRRGGVYIRARKQK